MSPVREVQTKFWSFSQNNSGGSFRRDEKAGIDTLVVVEAINAADANSRAKQIGLYFDGDGDCPCCGSRWSEQWREEEGTEVPSQYGEPLTEWTLRGSNCLRYTAYIHYIDGRIEKIEPKVIPREEEE